MTERAQRSEFTRNQFLVAMRENRGVIAEMILRDPQTLEALSVAMARAGAHDAAESLRRAAREFFTGSSPPPEGARGGGPQR
jgi:hypothetical protein